MSPNLPLPYAGELSRFDGPFHNPGVGGSTPPPAANEIDMITECLAFAECLNIACVAFVYRKGGHLWHLYIPLDATPPNA